MGQRLELLLLERRRGGPGAGGVFGYPVIPLAQEVAEWGQGPPRPAAHTAPPTLAPTGAGTWGRVSPGEGRGQDDSPQ